MLSFIKNLTESIRVTSSLHISLGKNESKLTPSQEVDLEVNEKYSPNHPTLE